MGVKRSEVKVSGQGQGKGHGVKSGEGSRLGSRSGEGLRFGVKVRGQGHGVKVRVMIGGHKVWGQGRGSMLGV